MSATPETIASNNGERLVDVGRGIELCCETFGDPADPPLLLVMGLGMQMVHWPLPLIAQLVDRGLYVIRFDNRDRGCSTHVQIAPPTPSRLVTRRFGADQYTLEDMALDTVGLLDALELESVHDGQPPRRPAAAAHLSAAAQARAARARRLRRSHARAADRDRRARRRA